MQFLHNIDDCASSIPLVCNLFRMVGRLFTRHLWNICFCSCVLIDSVVSAGGKDRRSSAEDERRKSMDAQAAATRNRLPSRL